MRRAVAYWERKLGCGSASVRQSQACLQARLTILPYDSLWSGQTVGRCEHDEQFHGRRIGAKLDAEKAWPFKFSA